MTYWERLLAEYVGGGDSPISPTLIAKSITTNGTYNAVDDEADGYSSVSVNVPNTSTLKGTLPLSFKTSEEQLRDWTIYGSNYEHTYSAEGTLPLTFTSHTAGNASDWEIRGNDESYQLFEDVIGQSVKNWAVSENARGKIADKTLTAGTYTLWYYQSTTMTSNARNTLLYYDFNISSYVYQSDQANRNLTAGWYGWTFTLTENSTITLYLWVNNPDTAVSATNFILTKGETQAPSTYIPYQQGVGERTVNLWNKNDLETGSIDSSTGQNSDGSTALRTASYIELELGETYYMTAPNGGIRVYKYDANKQYINSFVHGAAGILGISSTTKYIRTAATANSYPDNLMLIKGSTAPSTYVPYGYEIPISCDTPNTYNETNIQQGTVHESSPVGSSYATVISSPYLSNRLVTSQPVQSYGMTIECDFTKYRLFLAFFDSNKEYLGAYLPDWILSKTLVDNANYKYVAIAIRKIDNSDISPSEISDVKLKVYKHINDYTFYIDSPLTAGQSISKTSTGIDIAAMAGSNTITTGLYNKPEMSITGFDYVGVGEPTNDGWQIPLTVSDGTNTATVNVPIEAPLTSTDSVSGVVDIPTYVGTNTIDTTLVEPVTADIVYVGANSTLINKTVNQNGTYFAYSDNANGYNSVAVDVPNTYTNEDESKVVHNGELVAQTTASVTTNGIVDTTAIRSVSVNVPTAGSVTGDVRFLDYDGTVVQAYSKSDFASLTALPANPTHEGLTAQGWNWSLEDAKMYVAAYDKLDIGQMYITNDGKTRLYVTLDDGRRNPTLAIAVNGSCDVDWGDGTTHDTLTGTNLSSRVAVSHTYATGGDYVIALTVTGAFAFVGGSNGSLLLTYNNVGDDNRTKGYRNILRGVEIGDGITTINRYAFANCLTLSNITIPDSVISIEDNVFNTCIALSSITIPDNVESVAAYTFDSCYSLSSVTIPNSVTLIGGTAFRYCYVLSSVTIPNRVTRIGVDVFRYCYGLSSVTIPNSVTEIGTYAFDSCYSLSSVTIPNGVTTIEGSVFGICRTLVDVTIPNSVTSISAYAFSGCATLPSITIPASVTSMGGNVFASCGSLSSIVFQSETPPTISSSSAFYNVPTDCIIYVPTGSLADYTSAQYYPSSSSYTYVEY